ncbi:MAG: M20 family metallopeptidase [Spirochaetales bacterium]|nr:M20 family metallopeptidase [Spirochaetales bacterium]
MNALDTMNKALKVHKKDLIALSKDLHTNPELSGEEYRSMERICSFLEARGFKNIEKGIGNLPTAFRAIKKIGDGEAVRVAFCAEYDALPDLGHACGHNLIAGASVTAGLLLSLCEAPPAFEVTIIGTPDEEVRGGKIDLIQAGVFDGLDLAMMFHPGFGTKINVRSLACRSWEFTFYGKNAHAAAEPIEGRNALDGVILTFTNINALRQYLKDDVRIHGIIKDGGKASNIIPDLAVAEICIRSNDNKYLLEVEQRVMDCARGAALASGTEVEITQFGNFYDAMISNPVLVELFKESLNDIGFVDVSRQTEGLGSIDMGNVSRIVPAIHPVLALTDKMIPGHTEGFADLCNTDKAYEVMLEAGKAMALTAYKVISSPELRSKMMKDFKRQNK